MSNCCLCKKKLEKIEHGHKVQDAGTIVLDFQYGSKRDAEIHKGFICDECASTFKFMKIKNRL